MDDKTLTLSFPICECDVPTFITIPRDTPAGTRFKDDCEGECGRKVEVVYQPQPEPPPK
jgi:hypothetical protein